MQRPLVIGILILSTLQAVHAEEESRATFFDAQKMVRRGMEFLQKNGRDKAAPEITAPSKTFVDRDLYLVIYDMKGNCIAHGLNAAQVGKNLLESKDADGKMFVKERVELAANNPSFRQRYKYTDPLTKKVLPKMTYCERSGELLVCGGVYDDS